VNSLTILVYPRDNEPKANHSLGNKFMQLRKY